MINLVKKLPYLWFTLGAFLCLFTAACGPATAVELVTPNPTTPPLARVTSTNVVTAASTNTATAAVPPLFTSFPSPTHTPYPVIVVTATPSPTVWPTRDPLLPVAFPPPSILPTPHGMISTTVRVPILMYHYISAPPEDADKYRVGLSVLPDHFREQMRYLVENGYTAIDFYDLILAITQHKELPPKPVILTFDDGYLDAYHNAFPILQEFGLKGTFFIITEYVDHGNPHHMNWAMIEEMSAAGHRMESHTKTHPNLSEKDWDTQIYEILGSQQTLAAHIGYTPKFLCYPGGRYNELTLQVLQGLDFWGAVTTTTGKYHSFNNRYEWKRLRIRFDTPLSEFIELLTEDP